MRKLSIAMDTLLQRLPSASGAPGAANGGKQNGGKGAKTHDEMLSEEKATRPPASAGRIGGFAFLEA